jgi:AbrB family looped-hinge helix DNA binding protein
MALSWKVGFSDNPPVNTRKGTIMPLAKVKQKGQVTIPAGIREELGLEEGDYVEIAREGRRIVLTPKDVIDRHPAIDAALAEGLEDVRAGRISPSFKSMKEFEAWLATEEGKRFGNK